MADGDEATAAVFLRLRKHSIELLNLVRDPKHGSSAFLVDMAAFVRCSDVRALQPCFDYTLFPLLLLLDASVQCRKGRSVRAVDSLGDLEVSDNAAEGTLMCIEALLGKCYLSSVDQMVVLMKKLTFGAMLSPLEASEEFRRGILRCFKTMLLQLNPCSVSSCLCKQTGVLSRAVSLNILGVGEKMSSWKLPESKQCLLAFLKSQDASAAVGHWLSLLLQSSEYEASQGQCGSAELRKESLLAMRILIAKVSSADSLAFFLPGIVSRLGKALHASRNIVGGAAGSASCTELALRGLTESLMLVLSDEENSSMLKSLQNRLSLLDPCETTTESALELLRRFPVQGHQNNGNEINVDYDNEQGNIFPADVSHLHVRRTKKWIEETASNVDKLLSATFPGLCVHPSEKVRRALVDGASGLLANCNAILSKSKQLLLDSLCVLACDDVVTVSEAAQESLDHLMQGETFLTETEVSDIFTSLVEKLPYVVLGRDETTALMHARKLLALVFYAGPELLLRHLFRSPDSATFFFDSLASCIGQNSQYGGSVDKIVSSRPLSVGYLYSVAELKALSCDSNGIVSDNTIPISSKIVKIQDSGNYSHTISEEYELPHAPPWFVHSSSHRLYNAIAGILRLVGLSTMTGHEDGASLAVLTDILLDQLRKLSTELRTKVSDSESLHQWYMQSSSGQILRQTSVAVCMLNEMMYGLSHNSLNALIGTSMSNIVVDTAQRTHLAESNDDNGFNRSKTMWKVTNSKDSRAFIIQCIGSIQHEYMSPEIWDLPTEQNCYIERGNASLPLYFFRDAAAIQQVIIEGIGIFGIVLSKDFEHSGFMHSSLYLLLQKLICATSQIRYASDVVLRVLSSVTGHATVGHFVAANADYVVDSLCRQLRHLDLNPQVPDVLSSVLSYIGAAHDILPFLEEPMRAVSLELEVLGRHEHPHLTFPFLKAVKEIAKACKSEAENLPFQAELLYNEVNSKLVNIQDLQAKDKDATSLLDCWENFQISLSERRRYRRIVGSLADSCLKSAIPLLSSSNEMTCLEALNIVENSVISVAMVEEAYKHERQTKRAIETAIQLLSHNGFDESVDVADEIDENRLLPAVNKLWPYMLISLKNRVSASVVNKCTKVLSRVVEISGGDFFIRRFQTDWPVFGNLLCSSPFRRKRTALSSKDEKAVMLLPRRSTWTASEEPLAEISSLKIQIAVLNMIADVSFNKRSSAALQSVLKKVSGVTVGIAYSSMTGLREAATKALAGLACIDSDLIWLLLADVYCSLYRQEAPTPPAQEFPELSILLPPPASSREYLYVQYGGNALGADLDPSSVKAVFNRLQDEVLS